MSLYQKAFPTSHAVYIFFFLQYTPNLNPEDNNAWTCKDLYVPIRTGLPFETAGY